MNRLRTILHALPCSLALLTGCNLPEMPGKPKAADRPVPLDRITDFATLYGMYCAGCHGADGRLGPAPPLNDEIFLAIVPDADLLRLMDEGRPGTPMPAFSQKHGGQLTDEQVRAIAEEIKPFFAKGQAAGTKLAKLAEESPAYAFTAPADQAAAAARGQELFGRACAGCHGDDGTGGGAGAVNESDFLALISDQALRRIIITGRPDLGMPTYAADDGRAHGFQPLSSIEIDDLVALLAQWRSAGGRATQPPATAAGPAARQRRLLTEARR